MRKGNFTVEIGSYTERLEEASDIGDFDVSVKIPHMTQYYIRIKSNSALAAEAEINIDGKRIYTQRIDIYSDNVYETDKNSGSKFTFIEDGTQEFLDAGLNGVPNFARGLITVVIFPEKERREVYQPQENVKGISSYSMDSTIRGVTRGGGTGMTGKSNQSFINVDGIDRDYDRSVTFTFKLKPVSKVSPLKAESGDDIDISAFGIESRIIFKQRTDTLFEIKYPPDNKYNEKVNKIIKKLVTSNIIEHVRGNRFMVLEDYGLTTNLFFNDLKTTLIRNSVDPSEVCFELR